jgi:hypothetical protein
MSTLAVQINDQQQVPGQDEFLAAAVERFALDGHGSHERADRHRKVRAPGHDDGWRASGQQESCHIDSGQIRAGYADARRGGGTLGGVIRGGIIGVGRRVGRSVTVVSRLCVPEPSATAASRLGVPEQAPSGPHSAQTTDIPLSGQRTKALSHERKC